MGRIRRITDIPLAERDRPAIGQSGKIDICALRRDVDQIWAEAAHYETTDEELFLSDDLKAMADDVQSARVAEDPWLPPLRDKLGGLFGKVKTEDVMAIIRKPVERQSRADARRLTDVMKALGWSREKQRFGGDTPVWCFVRRQSDAPAGEKLIQITVSVSSAGPGEPPIVRVTCGDERF